MVLFAPAVIEMWIAKGRKEGFQEGFRTGYKEGYKEGFEIGFKEGREQARRQYQAQFETARARIAELETQVRSARNSYQFDIA